MTPANLSGSNLGRYRTTDAQTTNSAAALPKASLIAAAAAAGVSSVSGTCCVKIFDARTRPSLETSFPVNVTSPTGIRAIKRLGGPDLAVAIWDAIEAKLRHGSALSFTETETTLEESRGIRLSRGHRNP